MTPVSTGQDILKEYAATQAKLKEIERERDLAVHERERVKAELQQIDQEMKDNKGYSPLDDMQERGGVENYLPFVINWVSRMEEATSESIAEANHILNAYGSGNLTALNETVGVEVSGEIPVEDPSVEIADGTVPEVRFEDLAPAGYSKPEEPVHPAMVAVEEPVAVKPEDTNIPETAPVASAPALNWGTGENNRSNGENNNSDNSTHNPWKDSDNNEWGSNLFNKGEIGDPSGFFSEGSGQNYE
jgi:hypothetical protein